MIISDDYWPACPEWGQGKNFLAASFYSDPCFILDYSSWHNRSEGSMKFITTGIFLIVFSSPCFAQKQTATREVLLDNESVEVIRLTYPPGTESGMHTHEYPNRAVYFVKGGFLEVVPGDSQQDTVVIEAPDGTASYLPAATHNVRNIGETEIVIIETEIK
jgi:mannose-6-phosphate isomerase-like protein (cupin superfamily)